MSPAGLALGVLAVALLVGSFIWRRRLVAARRIVAALLLVAAVALTIVTRPSPAAPNRPAPVAGGALLYTVVTSVAANGYTPQPASIVALDARTGATRWGAPLPETSVKIVTVSGQLIIAAAPRFAGTSGGRVLALEAMTGAVLWQYLLADHEGLDNTYAAVPDVVVGAANIFLHTVDLTTAPPTRQERVTALRATDGVVLWEHELQNQELASAPAVTPGAVFLGGTNTIEALNLATGATLWKITLPSGQGLKGLLIASRDAVYLSTYEDDGYTQDVVALRATDGAVLWRVPVSHGNLLRLIAGPDAVFAVINGKVLALNLETGAVRWQLGNDDLQGGTALSPHDVALVGDTLYLAAEYTGPVGDAQGRLTNPETVYAVDTSSGAVRWTYATRSGNSGHMTVEATSLYMSADDGLAVLSTTTGAPLWRSKAYGLPSDGVASSADTPGVIFVGSSDFSTESPCFLFCKQLVQHYLSAVNADDGAPYWRVKIGTPQTVLPHWVL